MTTRAPIVLVAAVGLLGLAGCNQYDQLIAKDQSCDARWADYQAQLQRRYDLIPNLVATVKASAQHEEKTLTEVTEARASATEIKLSGDDFSDPEKVAAFQKAQDQLQGRAVAPAGREGGLPRPQGERAVPRSHGAARGHREPHPARARAVQRGRAATTTPSSAKIRGAVVNKVTGKPFKPRVYFQASSDAQQAPKVTF